MAHNPNTRLLLKFNNGAGSTATDDTSSYARSATITGGEVSSAAGVFSTNSVVLGDPFGSGSAGDVTVNNVSSLFSTSSNSLKRVDLWFRPEADSPWGTSPLFSITFQNGDTLVVWYSVTSFEVEYNGTVTDPTHYLYQSVEFSKTLSQWYHLRFAINGDTLKMALDGAETHSITHTTDVWTGVSGNQITEFRIGCWPSAYDVDANSFVRGYIDAVEFVEGDLSWFGGSYAVPSAEPDDYSGSGTYEVFGESDVSVDDVSGTGYDTGMEVISGEGICQLDVITNQSQGIGMPVCSGAGIYTCEDVQGVSLGGGPDLNTRLMLHFDNSTGRLKDSSLYNRTVSLYGGDVSPNYTGLFQSDALGLESTLYGTSIGCSAYDMFDVASQKSFEFFYYNNASDTNYRYIFQLTFANGHFINILTGPFYSLLVEISTPNAPSLSYMHDNAFLFAGWKSIALGIVGNDVFLGLDGVQIWTGSGTGPVWPQADAPDKLRIGNNVAYTMNAGAQGRIEHFRIREGEGYAGGNYTAPQYPWYPGQKLGQGSANLESVAGVGEGGINVGILGMGDAHIGDITQRPPGYISEMSSFSYGNVYHRAQGMVTLDSLVGSGDNLGNWSGVSTVQLDITTSVGSGALSWVFKGVGVTSLDSMSGQAAGHVSAVPDIFGSGRNYLASVTQVSTGVGVRYGEGSATLQEVFGAGTGGYPVLNGVGEVAISIISGVGEGSAFSRGAGAVAVESVIGVGQSISGPSGYGLEHLDLISSLSSGKIVVSGSGMSNLGDICVPRWVPDISHFVYADKNRRYVYGR